MMPALYLWAAAGALSWLCYDARYFNDHAAGTVKYLLVQIVLGPLSWLRVCLRAV